MTLFRIYYQCYEEKLPVSELDIHPDMLSTLQEMGVVDVAAGLIDAGSLRRLNKIQRLKNFLGVNLTGAAIIADLLERIEDLEEEVEVMKRKR
ncbi:MAG TPA: chaperone modulator CbpM [Syntrophomonadaceae bacterium]|nr:chaperone modulator CbpM [Syntrophomonadaceae bacterium]